MSFIQPSQKSWQSLVPNQTVAVGLVQVKLSYKSRMPGERSPDMRCVWDIFRDSFHAIAEICGGKVLSWHGHDGSFTFLIEDDDSFNNCCLAAVQMLDMVPSINEDIRLSTDIDFPIEVCILCDTGNVAYNPEPTRTSGVFVDQIQKYCQNLRADGALIVTDRIHRHLEKSFKSRFEIVKHSPELDIDLHSTMPLSESDVPINAANLPVSAVLSTDSTAPQIVRPSGAARIAAKEWLKRHFDRLKSRQRIAIGLVAACLLGILIGRYIVPSASNVSKLPGILSSDDWLAWKKHAYRVLTTKPVTEATLVEALQNRPAVELDTVSARLRRDQAVADVLVSCPGVINVLRDRLGVDEQFLGTGLSKIVTDKDYRATFIHEYLIPNEAVVSPQVWMRQFHAVGDALNKTVKELVMEKSDSSENQDKQLVRKQVINQVETIDSNNGLRPVIRFARLPIKKFKNRLGRDERYRVFASDLAEVWNRKLQDAANLSGYNTNDGDEFFIFVYLPLNPDQAVPATWDEVLKHIPTWFKEGENRGE